MSEATAAFRNRPDSNTQVVLVSRTLGARAGTKSASLVDPAVSVQHTVLRATPAIPNEED